MATLAHPARTAGDQGLPYGLKGTSKGEDYLISFQRPFCQFVTFSDVMVVTFPGLSPLFFITGLGTRFLPSSPDL